jgi:signal transduction histidine kinase
MLGNGRKLKLTKEQEEGCRQHYLPTDINQAKLGVLLLVFPFVAFIYNDYRFLNFSWEFFATVALRIIILSCIVFVFVKLGKVKNYRSYDRIVTFSCLAIMIVSGFINATRPQNYIVQIIATGISVFILYLVIPNRFSYQILLSSTVSVGESAIVLLFLQSSDISSLVTVFVSLGFANIIAIASSWQIHNYRKTSYLEFLKNKELTETLEQHTKNLEVIIAERTEKLRDAERLAAIGATAGMVGHDIRNPLTAITGAVYIAKKNLTKFPESTAKTSLEQNLDLIGDQTIYVNKIVADLQDFASPLRPNIEETNLKQVAQSVLSTLKIPKNISVELLVNDDFPKLKLDQTYMQRILMNLCTNAVQAMPNGGKLTINGAQAAGKVMLTVEDTGEGISEETKSKLFTPLVTTKSKGQGFGLAVVKRLTEAQGGTVMCESIIGKGTKFTIQLSA